MNPENEFFSEDNDPLPDVPQDIEYPSEVIEKGNIQRDDDFIKKDQ